MLCTKYDDISGAEVLYSDIQVSNLSHRVEQKRYSALQAKIQYLHTCKVGKYCILSLHGSDVS